MSRLASHVRSLLLIVAACATLIVVVSAALVVTIYEPKIGNATEPTVVCYSEPAATILLKYGGLVPSVDENFGQPTYLNASIESYGLYAWIAIVLALLILFRRQLTIPALIAIASFPGFVIQIGLIYIRGLLPLFGYILQSYECGTWMGEEISEYYLLVMNDYLIFNQIYLANWIPFIAFPIALLLVSNRPERVSSVGGECFVAWRSPFLFFLYIL